MTTSDDCPDKANSPVTPADEALALEMLEDLDLSGDDEALKAGLMATSPALRAVVAGKKKRNAAKARTKSMKPSAIEERKRYHIVKVAEGRGKPRDYNGTGIAPRHHGGFETEDEYQRRYKRDYARLARGVDTAELEAKKYLREVTTPDEQRANKAAASRKARASATPEKKTADNARKKKRRDDAKARTIAEAAASAAPPKIF